MWRLVLLIFFLSVGSSSNGFPVPIIKLNNLLAQQFADGSQTPTLQQQRHTSTARPFVSLPGSGAPELHVSEHGQALVAGQADRPGHMWDRFLNSTLSASSVSQADLTQADAAAKGAPAASFDMGGGTTILPISIAWLLQEAQNRWKNTTLNDRLNEDVAKRVAAYTSVSYCNISTIQNWNCTRCGTWAAGMTNLTVIYDVAWDLSAYVGWSPWLNATVVAFRGTDSHSIYNWIENMRYWQSDLHLPYPLAEGARVHTGFFLSYNSSMLQPSVAEAVRAMQVWHPGSPVYLMGHSMGSALATISAVELRLMQGVKDVRLYTFGSPRIGNDIFATFAKKLLKESYRFTHNRDVVPSLPLQIMGFHHLSTEVWLVDYDGARVVGICDGSGEDPQCHNSVCLLGFCTSLNDHMHYMGVDMFHASIGC